MSTRPTPPRLALTPAEAAEAIGVSRDYFDEHVLPNLRVVAPAGRGKGRRVLIAVAELERYLDREGAITLEAHR